MWSLSILKEQKGSGILTFPPGVFGDVGLHDVYRVYASSANLYDVNFSGIKKNDF